MKFEFYAHDDALIKHRVFLCAVCVCLCVISFDLLCCLAQNSLFPHLHKQRTPPKGHSIKI